MVLVGEVGKALFSSGTCLEESWRGGVSDVLGEVNAGVH